MHELNYLLNKTTAVFIMIHRVFLAGALLEQAASGMRNMDVGVLDCHGPLVWGCADKGSSNLIDISWLHHTPDRCGAESKMTRSVFWKTLVRQLLSITGASLNDVYHLDDKTSNGGSRRSRIPEKSRVFQRKRLQVSGCVREAGIKARQGTG